MKRVEVEEVEDFVDSDEKDDLVQLAIQPDGLKLGIVETVFEESTEIEPNRKSPINKDRVETE